MHLEQASSRPGDVIVAAVKLKGRGAVRAKVQDHMEAGMLPTDHPALGARVVQHPDLPNKKGRNAGTILKAVLGGVKAYRHMSS